MADNFSVNIGACDESHCSTCGLCDKGALFENKEPQVKEGIMNIVLINMGIKKTICSLVDGASGTGIGTMAFLNNDEDELSEKLTDVVTRLTAGKTYGLIVAAGEQTRIERIAGLTEICGTKLVIMSRVP